MMNQNYIGPTIRTGFRPLTRINSCPNCASIKTLKKETHCNARTMVSINGNGTNSHLQVCHLLPDYNARIAPHVWVEAILPLPLGQFQVDTNQAHVQRETVNYQTQHHEYSVHQATDNACSSNILGHVNEPYCGILSHPEFGCSQFIAAALINHLELTYGAMHHKTS
jgi:hypothetical protein